MVPLTNGRLNVELPPMPARLQVTAIPVEAGFVPAVIFALSVEAPDGYRVDSLNGGSTRHKTKKTKNTHSGEKSNVDTPSSSPLDPPINDTAPGDNNSPMPGESKDPTQSPVPDLGTTGKAGMNG